MKVKRFENINEGMVDDIQRIINLINEHGFIITITHSENTVYVKYEDYIILSGPNNMQGYNNASVFLSGILQGINMQKSKQ